MLTTSWHDFRDYRNEIFDIKCLAQRLAPSTCSINMGCYSSSTTLIAVQMQQLHGTPREKPHLLGLPSEAFTT